MQQPTRPAYDGYRPQRPTLRVTPAPALSKRLFAVAMLFLHEGCYQPTSDSFRVSLREILIATRMVRPSAAKRRVEDLGGTSDEEFGYLPAAVLADYRMQIGDVILESSCTSPVQAVACEILAGLFMHETTGEAVIIHGGRHRGTDCTTWTRGQGFDSKHAQASSPSERRRYDSTHKIHRYRHQKFDEDVLPVIVQDLDPVEVLLDAENQSITFTVRYGHAQVTPLTASQANLAMTNEDEVVMVAQLGYMHPKWKVSRVGTEGDQAV